VVFDGYDEMSTKAMTQQRCASGKVTATVTFTESMSITLKKDNFLSNPKEQAPLFDYAESSSTECRLRDTPLRW